MDQPLQEQYIALLCRYQPDAVLPYIQAHDAYRVEIVLPTCQQYNVLDAQAFLLERAADVEAALTIHVQQLSHAVQQLVVRVLAQTTSQGGGGGGGGEHGGGDGGLQGDGVVMEEVDMGAVLTSATGKAAALYVCECVVGWWWL